MQYHWEQLYKCQYLHGLAFFHGEQFPLYTTVTLVYSMYKRHICLIEVIVFLILVVVRTYSDPIPHMCEVCSGGEPSFMARLTGLYISYYFMSF